MKGLFFLTLFVFLVFPVVALDSSEPVCGDGIISYGETRNNCCFDVDCGFQMSCDGVSNSCIFAKSNDNLQKIPGITGYSTTPIPEEFENFYFIFLGIAILSFVSYYNFFLKR